MIKGKENIIMENTEKMSQLVRAYVEEMDAMSETEDGCATNLWVNIKQLQVD